MIKQSIRALAAVAITAAVVSACGCAGNKHAASNAPAADNATAAAQTGTAIANDGGGAIDLRTKDPASLGIPIYPGAKNSPGGNLGVSDKSGGGQMVILTSPDSFETVYAWYKSQLPADAEKMKTGIAGVATATFQVGPGDEKSGKFVTVSSSGRGDTIITLAVGSTSATAAGSSPAADVANAQQATPGQHDDLSTFGVATYPSVIESVMLPAVTSDEGKAEHGQLSTKDPFDTVYAWYKQRLPAGSEPADAAASNHTSSDGDQLAKFQLSTDPDSSVMIVRSKGDDATTVVFLRLTKNK